MARTRKNEPIKFNDDQLYALMRGLHRHLEGAKSFVPKPTGVERVYAREALKRIEAEFWARTAEETRIYEELKAIADEYENIN
jgi:hypothetical protein